MQHFFRLATGLDTRPAMLALQRQSELWNAKRFRTTFENTPHGAVDDILLRFSDDTVARDGDTTAVMADGRCVWHPAAAALPEVKPIALAVMNTVGAYALDRLVITRLRPGRRILPHADNVGDYVHDPERARFHVVLQGLPGSLYTTGDETVTMLTGETWWFNPLEVHSIQNNSADDRVHLLVDVRTWPK